MGKVTQPQPQQQMRRVAALQLIAVCVSVEYHPVYVRLTGVCLYPNESNDFFPFNGNQP